MMVRLDGGQVLYRQGGLDALDRGADGVEQVLGVAVEVGDLFVQVVRLRSGLPSTNRPGSTTPLLACTSQSSKD
jgi:hypothetical protein